MENECINWELTLRLMDDMDDYNGVIVDTLVPNVRLIIDVELVRELEGQLSFELDNELEEELLIH